MLHQMRHVSDTLVALTSEVQPNAAYSPDLVPFDYHLFASMGHALTEQRFGSYENVKKMNSQQNGKIFTGVVFTNCPKVGENI